MYKLLVLLLSFFSCSSLIAELEQLRVEIISSFTHDRGAFTQGLAIENESLYESTGQYGTSSLRLMDLKSGKVLEHYELPSNYFGEGIAWIKGQIIQLTWQEEVALVYALHPIRLTRMISYAGDGWGLCSDGDDVLMTNGSSSIYRRDSKTFALKGEVKVHLNGQDLSLLNDLVCVKNEIYANVWRSDKIFRINKESGGVTGVIDTSNLLSTEERRALSEESVLNGIAYDEKRKTFFITGKNWPHLFEVRFLPKK